MSQYQAGKQQQQQQQAPHQRKFYKNYYKTRKTTPRVLADTRENGRADIVSWRGDGAGDMMPTRSAQKLGKNEKHELHASEAHFDLGLRAQTGQLITSKGKKSAADRNSQPSKLNIKFDTEKTAETANESNKVNEKASTEKYNQREVYSKSTRMYRRRRAAQRNKYVAMDCEMVGVGYNGHANMLARVSIVNKFGDVLLDKFVKPREVVTDYRTSISGIRPHDIEHAEEFNAVQNKVVELLQGKVLVGHAIRNDLAVLHIRHPYTKTRDTSRYQPLSTLLCNGRTPSLKLLTHAILGLHIQTGEHDSVEDARAAMNIYNRLSKEWENYIQQQYIQQKSIKNNPNNVKN